jgi:hypothetical protein
MEVPDTALIRLNVKSKDEALGSLQSLRWDKELCERCRKASTKMENRGIAYMWYSDICEWEESKSRCLGCAILFEVGKTCFPGLANVKEPMVMLRFCGNEVKGRLLVVEPGDIFSRNISIKVLLSGKPGWCLHGRLLHCLILFRPTQSVESGNLPQPFFCNDGDR